MMVRHEGRFLYEFGSLGAVVAAGMVFAVLAEAEDGVLGERAMESDSAGVAVRDRVRLGLLHGVPEKWNVERNCAVFLGMLDEARARQVDILVTPECWLDGYAAADKGSTPERLRTVAQDVNTSSYLTRVAEEARKRSLFICFGFTSLEHEQIYNAAGLWDDAGQLVGVYHKTHLQRHDLQFAPGEALPTWPTPWGPVGIIICADRRWPETVRALRLEGARLILNPSYGFTGDLNEAMMRTRAYENQCFVAFVHPNLGLVTDPKGAVLAKEESATPGLLVCEVDLTGAQDDNHLRDRRPELYKALTRPMSPP